MTAVKNCKRVDGQLVDGTLSSQLQVFLLATNIHRSGIIGSSIRPTRTLPNLSRIRGQQTEGQSFQGTSIPNEQQLRLLKRHIFPFEKTRKGKIVQVSFVGKCRRLKQLVNCELD